MPYQAGWQDIKDLFRNAGNIVRADINYGFDGRPKGSGLVIYETAKDAQNAIGKSNLLAAGTLRLAHLRQDMYNGYDWYGRILEVREVTIRLIKARDWN